MATVRTARGMTTRWASPDLRFLLSGPGDESGEEEGTCGTDDKDR